MSARPAEDPPSSAARSFGAAADAYERGRPHYPDEAIDWLVPPGARRVLDLGAGTGKLTRQLCRRGLEVVAVEPLAGMRAQLSAAAPEATLLEGTAESLPLPSGSVEAVLVAQAWHWIDPARAVPEVARVLTGGGRLGLVWNTRDERQGWPRDLGRLMRAHGEHGGGRPRPVVGPPFGELEGHRVAWAHRLTREELVDLVASRSYVITLPAAARGALLGAVRHLADTHPDLAGAEWFTLPYVTYCFRTDLS